MRQKGIYLFVTEETFGELIYTCKMIQPGIFSRFSQPAPAKYCKIFRLQPGKIYRLTEPVKNARLDHFTVID